MLRAGEEQVKRFYTVPDIKKAEQYGTRLKFRYNAEIMERICTNPAMRQNITSQSIGYTMSRLGFPKAHRSKGNGWWVIEKEGAEINTDRSGHTEFLLRDRCAQYQLPEPVSEPVCDWL